MSRAEQRILAALANGEWHREDALGTTFDLLQTMYLRGQIEGAMLGFGSVPSDRVWRLAIEAESRS
jgi:hypothetical protein